MQSIVVTPLKIAEYIDVHILILNLYSLQNARQQYLSKKNYICRISLLIYILINPSYLMISI